MHTDGLHFIVLISVHGMVVMETLLKILLHSTWLKQRRLMHTDGLHFTVLSVHGMVAMETLSDIITLHLVETAEAYAYRWFTLHSVNKRTRHGCNGDTVRYYYIPPG